jgi:hypothetical protein
MKKLLTTLFLFLAIINLSAEISVKSFRKLENDLDARVNAPIKDFNGDVSAIIKVVTTETGFSFDCGTIGVVKTVNKPAEIWVYVPYGAKRMTITHGKLGLLRDYMIPMPIEKATVYEMVITTGKIITTVEETIESQWLVITPEPNDATVYLDEVFVKSGMYQAKLKPGSYTYRIEAPLYHTEAGKVEITDAKKEIIAKLKPAFGYVNVTTSPEKDAKVIIDGKTLTTNTPCKSDALASGEHTVQVIKEMYQPTAQKVTVTDGQTTPINFTMQPNFAELTITAPTNAILYVNNEKKATGNWNGRLNAGVYSLEARLDKHRTAKQDIEVTAGDKKTIDLQPTPIYGSLDVVSTPAGASISINGKEYGTTPNTVSKLLIGEYTVVLSKVGCADVKKRVVVVENINAEINEKLSNGWIGVINSPVIGAPVYIDSILVGKIPYHGNLSYGKHIIQIENTKGKISLDQNSPTILNIVFKEIYTKTSNTKLMYINQSGKYLYCGKYEEDRVKNDGFHHVRLKDKWGCTDENGFEILPCEYNSIDEFSDGMSMVINVDNKVGFINKSGKLMIPFIYDINYSGEGGGWRSYVFKNGSTEVLKNGKYGIIDKSGNVLKDFIYDQFDEFAPNIFRVELNKKFGLIDSKGQEIVGFDKYEFIGDLYENRAWVTNNNKYGYIDELGNLVIPIKYESDGSQPDYYVRSLDGRFGQTEYVKAKKDGKYGVIDKDDKEVIPFIYDYIDISVRSVGRDIWPNRAKIKDVRFIVQLKDKEGIIDSNGKIIVSIIYDHIGSYDNIKGYDAELNKVSGRIDENGNFTPKN